MSSKRRNHKKMIMEQKKDVQMMKSNTAEVEAPVQVVKSEEKKTERKLFLQYGGLEFSDQLLFEAAENDYCKTYSVSKDEINHIDLYVKPEESKAYYVVNADTEKTGFIEL